MSKKKSGKSTHYEAVPASIVLPLIPIPTEHSIQVASAAKANPRQQLQVQTFTTTVQNIDAIQGYTNSVLQRCSKSIRRNRLDEFSRVISQHPNLAQDQWVQSQLHRYRNRLHQPRGRPGAIFTQSPQEIAGLVHAMQEYNSSLSLNQAMANAAEMLDLSLDVVRRNYLY